MKKLLFILLVVFLAGCQKYEQVSQPNLTGGMWIFTDYDIVVISSVSSVTVVKNDTVCVNSFSSQTIDSAAGVVVMSQMYNLTSLDRRFIRGKTKWEFDNSNYYLYCNFSSINGGTKPTHDPFWCQFPLNPGMTSYDRMTVNNTIDGSRTSYTFTTNATGKAYPTLLTLTSPEVITDLYMSNGSRSKAVTVQFILRFTRN